jgi:hypothetical protein
MASIAWKCSSRVIRSIWPLLIMLAYRTLPRAACSICCSGEGKRFAGNGSSPRQGFHRGGPNPLICLEILRPRIIRRSSSRTEERNL